MSKRCWTAEEDRILRAGYPDYWLLSQQLPGRSYFACRGRSRLLGITRKRHTWTGQEVKTFEQLRRSGLTWAEVGALHPSRSIERVQKLLRKRKAPPKALGLPLLDEVRQRAFAKGVSLTDLDAALAKGNYFSHCDRSERLSAIDAAVDVLGGKLIIEWDEQ